MKIPTILLALGACLFVSACSSTQQQKALSAVSTISTTAVKLQAQEAAAVPLVASVSGSSAKLSNDIAYAETITQDAQTLAPLLSGLISLIPTSSTTASAYRGHYWTPKGVVALRKRHISPMDRYAIEKLSAPLASLDMSHVAPSRGANF